VSKDLDFPSAAHVVEVASLRLAAWRGSLRQRRPPELQDVVRI
jgi:hypothetical protein